MRLVRFIKNGPDEVTIGGVKKSVCKCGLSKDFPFCDGSHKKTRDEDQYKTYIYHDDGSRDEV